jgi:hypothetical protein
VVEWNAPGGNGDVNIPADLARTKISKRRRDDATADELRAEIMKRLAVLTSAGLIDLAALPASSDGIANQPIPSADQSGINGE